MLPVCLQIRHFLFFETLNLYCVDILYQFERMDIIFWKMLRHKLMSQKWK